MKNILFRVAVFISFSAFSLFGQSASAVVPDIQSNDERLIEFIQSHPGEFAAIDRLSIELLGENYWVKLPDLPIEVTGTEAEAHIDSRTSSRPTRATLPSDTFSVTVGRATVTGGIYITGSVVFKATYAGQADPDDIGSLQFAIPACMALTNHTVRTYNANGLSTGLGYLSNPNLANDAPIWRISDYTSGFVNQAHRSVVTVLLTKSGCAGSKTVQTAFVYEHNQSGAIQSIGSSFGLLSITYDVPTYKLKKSSSVMTFTW